jgi:ubiquinone/menaquinone biosynthesis C-methylase UbiE
MVMAEKSVKDFWDEKATAYGKSMRATLGEIHLRRLEIRTLLNILKRQIPSAVLEIGCGNGFSTFAYAEALPQTRFIATDYSDKMLEVAHNYYHRENIEYLRWDITDIESCPITQQTFDVIFSQRVIQNLPSWQVQMNVITNLITKLTDEGRLYLMECSEEGVSQLNRWRTRIGRKPIDTIIPWHNKFLRDSEMKAAFHGNLIETVYFSSTYMFITRLISGRLSKIAWLLPPWGRFGYDRIYVFKA